MKQTLLPLVLVILTACSKTFDRPYTDPGTTSARTTSNGDPQVCDFGIRHFNLSKRPMILDRKPVKNPPGNVNDAVLLLDFDGHIVSNTRWNFNGDINCAPANISSDAISDILFRVANDYSPFNLTVTTSDSLFNATAKGKRMRLIVTESYEWYGIAGGVSYIGSFTWNDDTPGFVFSSLLNYDTKMIAEAISHEAGHTLGLYHQSSYDLNCIKLSDYNYGQGTGETGWAPIMGAGYYQNLTLWHNGCTSNGCTSRQDDVAIISGATKGLRADDYSNTRSQAKPLTDSLNGLINNSTDIDFFYIDIAATKTIIAEPFSCGLDNEGANIDLAIRIYDNQGRLLLTADDPQRLQSAATLAPGKYWLAISSVPNQYTGVYGMLGWYSIRITDPEL